MRVTKLKAILRPVTPVSRVIGLRVWVTSIDQSERDRPTRDNVHSTLTGETTRVGTMVASESLGGCRVAMILPGHRVEHGSWDESRVLQREW